ncbi:SusF/SusE family outer membrane protein [Labilibacter sediminis]|nr:SusF/SusE family outer membrane protein [Labilibacter sediminis]
MKIFQIIAFVILGAFIFASCEDEDKITYNPDLAEESALVTPLSPNGLMFTKDDADEMINFSWTETDAKVNVQIDYEVQLSSENTFENIISLFTTRESEMDVKVSVVNNALISLKYAPEEQTTVYCRVIAKINDNVENLISGVVDYETIPYETIIDYPMIYVPGAYQGWSPGADNGRLYSYEFNDIYEGIVHIASDDDPTEFKIAATPDWGEAYGGVLAQAGNDYSGTLDGAGGNFSVVPGAYSFRVDMDALTIEMTKTDYWGVIGDAAGGWGDADDVIMHYNGQIKKWQTTTTLNPGGFKFRKNSSWGGDLTGDENGNLTSSGDNIAVTTAGTYDIVFDLENMVYSFTLVE